MSDEEIIYYYDTTNITLLEMSSLSGKSIGYLKALLYPGE
jgi:hypothetical protein